METKPIKQANKPKYPDKYQIAINRDLLKNHPKAWHKEPLLALSLTGLLSSALIGCKDSNNYGHLAGDMTYTLEISQITDEEALKIIAEELEKAGYSFTAAQENESFDFDGALIVDDKKINLEFVSYNDYQNLKYPEATVDEYHHFPTQSLALQLKAIYQDAAIFYAPNNYEDEETIRQQVMDFLTWLAGINNQ